MATRKARRGKAKKATPKPAKAKPALARAKSKPGSAKAKASPAKAKAKAPPAKPKRAAAKPKAKALSKVATAMAKVASVAKAVAKVAKAAVGKGGRASAAPPASKGGVEVGGRAPSFSLKDQSGNEVDSASLAGAPYVLYFYPKDDTSGCTKEACGFRDSLKGFGQARARVIGVSPDSEASHERFAKKYGLPFTLLSDPEKKLANAYGVWVKKQNYGRQYMGILRSTFVVDESGKIAKAYRGVRVDGHVPAVLEAVQTLA